MKNRLLQQNYYNQIIGFDFEIQFFPNLMVFPLYLKDETLTQIANNVSKNIQFQRHDGEIY